MGILGWQVFRARAAAELAAAILRDLSGAVRERKEEMDGAEMRKRLRLLRAPGRPERPLNGLMKGEPTF